MMSTLLYLRSERRKIESTHPFPGQKRSSQNSKEAATFQCISAKVKQATTAKAKETRLISQSSYHPGYKLQNGYSIVK